MPTSKRHTRRITQMACYLNSVVNSVMAEGDINMLSPNEVASLLRLGDTLNAFAQTRPTKCLTIQMARRFGIYGNDL